MSLLSELNGGATVPLVRIHRDPDPLRHIADADVLTALDPLHPRHPLCAPIALAESG